jgi:4-amino-4-deoxy-L-arabinose transferase-like glycosyltransferase
MSLKSIFTKKTPLLWISLGLIFAVGLGIRFFDLFDYPLDFASTRQLHSALIARGMYYQQHPEFPEWQRTLAVAQWKQEAHPEPQLLERAVALTYNLIGGENLWVARVYSILFWVIGGIGLFMLARDLAGTAGGLIALVYFLVLPYGVLASRAFQPDPLMVTLLIFTLWAINRWHKKPGWTNAILAGLLGSLAIYVKSVAVFFVAGAWIGFLVGGMGIRRALRTRQVWAIGVLSVLPYLAYYVYGMYIAGFLGNEFGMRFFPSMWLSPTFYLTWISELSSVVGFEWFIVALLAVFLIKHKALRGMFIGLLIGYVVYGMTLPYHISTHDYYQLPLIPIVALGLGVAGQVLVDHLQGSRRWGYSAIVLVILGVTILKSWDVIVTLKRVNYTNEVTFWQTFGAQFEHDDKIVGLLQDYGYRLAYWGWVDTQSYMSSADFNLRTLAGQQVNTTDAFEQSIKGRDYFVVTMFDELKHQPELDRLLYSNYKIVKESDDYVIFDLHKPIGKESALAPATAALW